jgi:hypothetical protein
MKFAIAFAAVLALGSSALAQQAQQPDQPLGFFVTSAVPGSGNLGGLEGADAICQSLADAVGAGDRVWRAYLSTQATEGSPAINARDRIGSGPWYNANNVLIAANVYDLHGDFERDRNYLFKDTAVDESGNVMNGRGDSPNQHDMLTGSDSHGRAWPAGEDRTCMNWTSDSDDAHGFVGHHDRSGGGNTSWNSVHNSRSCSIEGLAGTGGAGRFYCFAAD